MAPHSGTLAWKIPWREEPGRLQSMGSLRVRHDWVTSFSLFLSCTGEGNGNPLQCSCLESPGDGVAWWAAVYGVAQSQTQLKRLSSSSSSTSRTWGYKYTVWACSPHLMSSLLHTNSPSAHAWGLMRPPLQPADQGRKARAWFRDGTA